ncbi:RsmB/NOP family class I SAM-dependent RNA methyltransferase [Halothiobacillus sp. DCM-1]|uniref:RsmB/NOP family class I SAM-dependent RNA methyltransferase n=1 Tax=Halothiobacillus sp. DCM-1 TaxID=3112558 RepID=UPI003253B36E
MSEVVDGHPLPGPELFEGRLYPQHLLRAAELLSEIVSRGQASDRALAQAFRADRRLGRRDRLLIQTLVFYGLRYGHALKDWLGVEAPLAQLAAALWLDGRLDERLATQAGVDPARWAGRVLTPRMAWSMATDDAVRLTAAFGDEAAAVAAALLMRAPVDIRLDARWPAETVIRALQTDGHEFSPLPGLARGWRCDAPAALVRHPLFLEGAFEIQDAGSQWITMACAASPGERWLDLCAGAGGKTLGLAEAVGPTGRVLACDTDAQRLARLPERQQRHRLEQIDRQQITGADDPALAALPLFDGVLIDAPCSGSGTWRRHPELKYRSLDLAALCAIQADLLRQGAQRLRPGGRLIYATCSLWREENEQQIAAFLAENPDWQPGDLPAALPEGARIAAGQARLRPDRHDCDGFFMAVLLRPLA